MASQTYIKRNKFYVAKVLLPGGADIIDSVHQVHVSAYHGWGDAIFPSTRLASAAAAGSASIDVVDILPFQVGQTITIHDGRPEFFEITALSADTITLNGELEYGHNANIIISAEYVAGYTSDENYFINLQSYHLLSSGPLRLVWHYEQEGEPLVYTQEFIVYQPYITESEFFDSHPELETDHADSFVALERKVHNIINTYCGQDFDYYDHKTLCYDGGGSKNLHLGMRLEEVISAYVGISDDITDIISGASDSNYILSSSVTFSSNLQYHITGNWGWRSVPSNITQAADILIADLMNSDSQYPKHGVTSVSMDTHSLAFDKYIFSSTGHLDADVLLLDYTLFIIGMI